MHTEIKIQGNASMKLQIVKANTQATPPANLFDLLSAQNDALWTIENTNVYTYKYKNTTTKIVISQAL